MTLYDNVSILDLIKGRDRREEIKIMNKTVGQLINKSGVSGFRARDVKSSIQEHLEYLIQWDGGYGDEGHVTIDYGFTNNGNTWSRNTFYWRLTKSGNLIIT